MCVTCVYFYMYVCIYMYVCMYVCIYPRYSWAKSLLLDPFKLRMEKLPNLFHIAGLGEASFDL